MRSFSFSGSTPVCCFFSQDERVQIITHVRPGKKPVTHRGRPREAKRTHPNWRLKMADCVSSREKENHTLSKVFDLCESLGPTFKTSFHQFTFTNAFYSPNVQLKKKLYTNMIKKNHMIVPNMISNIKTKWHASACLLFYVHCLPVYSIII